MAGFTLDNSQEQKPYQVNCIVENGNVFNSINPDVGTADDLLKKDAAVVMPFEDEVIGYVSRWLSVF